MKKSYLLITVLFAGPATSGRGELEGPQEVVGLLEVGADGGDF